MGRRENSTVQSDSTIKTDNKTYSNLVYLTNCVWFACFAMRLHARAVIFTVWLFFAHLITAAKPNKLLALASEELRVVDLNSGPEINFKISMTMRGSALLCVSFLIVSLFLTYLYVCMYLCTCIVCTQTQCTIVKKDPSWNITIYHNTRIT